MKLHIAYDKVEPYPLLRTEEPTLLQVPEKKCKRQTTLYSLHRQKRAERGGHQPTDPVVRDTPPAYDYKLGYKSLPDWVIANCQKTTDKKSGIVSDAADFSKDPEYFPDLLAKAVRVGIESSRIIAGLPELRILEAKK